MANFARLDENNKVIQVLQVDDSLEHRGEDYLANELGLGGRWIQASYNNNFRKQYPQIGGYTYDEVNDVFITPKPTEYSVLDEEFNWVTPQ
jgi:hypothetical protein